MVIIMAIQVDSRLVKQNDTFLALRGVSSDGHDYINKAIENGATKLIVERGTYSIDYETVEDTRKYLADYLKNQEFLKEIKIIGITGTNGKTTTAYLLSTALNKLGNKTAYIGTIGFYCGKKIRNLPNTTPDLLELYTMFKEAYDMGAKTIIMEVSSQGISYGRIMGIKFDIAAFTNLTQDHLDYHITMKDYALAKQQLFKQIKKDGISIINNDDSYKNYFLLNESDVTFGFAKSDFQITNYEMKSDGSIFTYTYKNKEYTINSNLIGKYNLYNLLLVVAIMHTLKYDYEHINKVIYSLSAPSGRFEQVKYLNNVIVIDYAHTPDAVSKLIETVKEINHNKIYTIFGCTGDRDRTKRPIMFDLISKESNHVIITNDDPHDEEEMQIVKDILENKQRGNYEVILNRKKAIEKGVSLLKENDFLLILGKGHEDFMIIKDKKIPFNDKFVLEEILNAKTVNK